VFGRVGSSGTFLRVIDDQHSWKPSDAPLWSWANLLSLDAVAVGVIWHFIFTVEFCERMPAAYEVGIIGLSIWLVYAADRLFDSMRLDRSRQHTLRHRIHYDYRGTLVVAWLIVLAIDTFLVVSYARESQLRWGFVAIALLTAYVAGVHLAGQRRKWVPKELQAGLILACGVSLSAWAELGLNGSFELIVSTLMAGLLFAANCLIIACWEQDLDSSQGFESWATRFPAARQLPPAILVVHLVVAAAMFYSGVLPLRMAECLIASDGLLLTVFLARRDHRTSGRVDAKTVAPVSPFGLLADAALVAPPVICVCFAAAMI
jgi:hypothetical protein